MDQIVFSNVTWWDLFIQLIGFIGLLMNVISFQFNTNKQIVGFQLVGCLFWTTHFILLGQLPGNAAAYTGAALNAVCIFRNGVFFMRPKAWAAHPAWLYVFCTCSVLAGIFTWNGPLSLLSSVAMLFSTTALYVKNTTLTRRLLVVNSVCWLIFDAMTYSIPGTAAEVFSLTSIGIAMFRFDRKKAEAV